MTVSSAAVLSDKAGKYLTFRLGNEEYGLEILKVQEIIGMMNITRVPKAPPYVRGVINLRGKVISVVDLRLKFHMQPQEATGRTCVIVVQVDCGATNVTMGIIVDEVSEVVDVNSQQIEPTPSFGVAVNNDFILGMGKVGDKVLILLDIDKVLSTGEVALVEQVADDE